MDEKKLLESFAKALGAESTLNEIEAKELRQKNMLKGMAKLLGTESLLSEMEEKEAKEKQIIEEKKAKEKELFDQLNNSLARLVENNPKQINIIEEEIKEAIEQPLIEDLHDLPQIPVRDIVTQAVVDLSKAQQKDVQQVADSIPDSFRKELDIIKKSIADFHRLAQRQSQMGGGGEVNLRYLDDVNRGSIFGGNFLKYNASSKKFEFANVTSDGVDWLHIPSDMIPESDLTYNIGNTSFYWRTSYSQNIYSNSVSIVNQTFLANQSILTVRGATGTPQTLTNPGALVHLVNQPNRSGRLIIDTYANSSYGLIAARTARGSIDAPSNLLANDVIFRIAGNGFGNTVFNSTSPVSIDYVTTENFSDTNRGSKIVFYTTQTGANVSSSVTSIEYDGIHLAHIVNNSISANMTNLHITGGANDYIMVADGLDNLIWRPRHTDGTWTPRFTSGGTNNITMSVLSASWSKSGPIVTCFFDANVSSMGTASGVIKFNGLPFAGKTDGEYVGAVEMQAFYNMNIADCIRITGSVIQNSNTADMFITQLNGQRVNFNNMLASDLKVTSRLIGSVIYSADF